MLQVQTSLLPFNVHHRRTVTLPEGLTLRQIVNAILPVEDRNLTAVVTVNGELIPAASWSLVKPKVNTVIGVNYVPMKGGGKNPLATIITIATMVAAPYLAAAYGVALGAAITGTYGAVTASTLALAQGIIRVGVSMIGFLASSALSSTPKQSSSTNTSNVRESPTQFIEGASNAILKWGVIPVNLGVNRMFPPQAALPYTETNKSNQYVRQLFTYGYGEVEISDEKIGETALNTFTDVEVDDKLNGDLNTGTTIYTNDVNQENLSITLLYVDGFSTVTTADNADEIEIDLTFPNGLVKYNEDGQKVKRAVYVTIRYAPTGTTDWVTDTVLINDARTSALRTSYRYVLPSNGQYDVEVKRDTTDDSSEQIRDTVVWTALKSVTLVNPVRQSFISGKALRIKATDQLNGSVEKYNAIVSTKCLDYDADADEWVTRVTSNPASLFRYVLQSDAFSKKLPDSRIEIPVLEEWHTYCKSLGLTYNRIIDYETSIEDVLRDIAAAGFASKHNIKGVYSVIIDNEKPIIKGVVTPRNSWGYKGSINYPEIPDALIIEFRNENKGYALDERTIYNTGYNEDNAVLYERIEFSSCTNADLAYIYGRRYLSNMKMQPESHTFYQDPEFLTLNRGDRFIFSNDTILVGVGSARIKSLTYDDPDTPTEVIGFVLDDTLTIPDVVSYGVRIRYSDASEIPYHNLTTLVGATNTFTFTTPLALTGYDGGTDTYLQERQLLNALCTFTEIGQELDLIVLSIESDSNYNAKITAINYAASRFITDQEPIPDFESYVTLPLGSYRPYAPELIDEVQADESVMVLNSDGTYSTRMVINLNNRNESTVATIVKMRVSGSTQTFTPDIVSISADQVILTGLQDNTNYDIEIYYQRLSGVNLLSLPLLLPNTKYIGVSGNPDDVTNFTLAVISDTIGILNWDWVDVIDLSHYEIRYSTLFSGATWESSQILDDRVFENKLTIPFRSGTYLIKAVDFGGNKSENATTIITINEGQVRNIVEQLVEQTAFTGVKDNVEIDTDRLIMTDLGSDGYYYFSNYVDLTAVASNVYVTSTIIAGGVSLAGTDTYDLFTSDDIFSIEDMFGIGAGGWYIELQYSTTEDDPSGTPTWTDWDVSKTGFYEFRAIRFRLLMRSLQPNISPFVSTLEVLIDMPDRIERGQGETVTTSGVTITYPAEFKNNPAVAVTITDGEADDKIEFTSKTSGSFTFKVYNESASSYVERTFDYVSSGYGRLQ